VVTEHAILEKVVGEGCTQGCNIGRIKPSPFTFANLMTESGELKFYLGEGRFTEDPIPPEFFGCAGVAEIPDLQEVLLQVGRAGHRHHVGVTPGHVLLPLAEALGYYLGHDVSIPQGQ
jgi:L-fucose isomerase-like protein